MEVWRDIPGFEGLYQVSNFGRVKSLDRWQNLDPNPQAPKGYARHIKGKIHRGTPVNRDGKIIRIVVGLRKDGRYFYRGIHEFVLLAFVGPRPEGYYGCHNDDTPTNNRLANLYWGTPKQNSADKIRHGNQPKGEGIPWSKLTERDVRYIRSKAGVISQSKLAKKFGVVQAQISRVVNGKEWTHVPD